MSEICSNPESTELLITFLSNPDVYPHPVKTVQKIETHISVVFLTGSFAYKLKKPVNFGFLDFSHSANRLKFCQKELELNQRTAPELYLDVIALFYDENGYSFSPTQPSQTPCDCLVKMRQFNPDFVLGDYCQTHPLDEQHIEQLAKQIAQLHLNAEMSLADSVFGEPKTALQPMLDNFPSLKKFFADTSFQKTLAQIEEIEQTTLSQFDEVQALLNGRKQQGFIRKCHGDLHLDNIALVDNKPLLFDAIEFNDFFSQIDVISDLAFLLIDLEYRNQKPLAFHILSLYLHLTQDYAALELLNFYKVYRSMVRAKISALQAAQNPIHSKQYNDLVNKTLNYLSLAKKIQTPQKQAPKLILIQGISGSGKSVLAKQLLNLTDAILISSDRTRKQLYGIDATYRVSDEERRLLYSASMSQQTYATMLNNTKTSLLTNFSVIVDATFLKQQHRQKFYELANNLGIDCYLLSIDIDKKLASESIQERLFNDFDPSDADHSVMEQQFKVLEPAFNEVPTLKLKAADLRHNFPQNTLKNFLKLSL